MPDEDSTRKKLCTVCQQLLPATSEYFSIDRHLKHGLSGKCRTCKNAQNRAYKKAWHAAHPEKAKQYRGNHRARRNAQSRTWYLEHVEERREYNRAYYATHVEKYAAKHKKFHKTHPGKASEYTKRRHALQQGASINDFTEAQWQAMQVAYDFRCVYCAPTCWRCRQKKHKLTQDHITPLSKGGNHTLSNIVPACHSCNSKKRTRSPLVPVQPLLLL